MVSKGDGGLTTSPSKRYLIMGLIGLAFIPSVLADDGSGCNNTSGSWNNGGTADCYSPQIYQQNQMLFQVHLEELYHVVRSAYRYNL